MLFDIFFGMESVKIYTELTIGSIWKKIVALIPNFSSCKWIVFIAANGALIFICSKIWYNSVEYNPWENLQIPWADRSFWLGSYKDNLRRPLHEVENKRYRIYNSYSIYGYFQGACPFISICRPNRVSRIKTCALKSVFPTGNVVLDSTLSYFETERWRRVRKRIKKVLHTENVMFRYAFEEVVNTMQDQVTIIKTGFGNGRPINVKKTFDAFAFDAACKTLLISDYETIKNPDQELLKEIRRFLNTSDKFSLQFIFDSHFPKIAEFIRSRFTDEDLMSFKNEVYRNISEKYFNETADFFLVRNALDVMFSANDLSFVNNYLKTERRLEDTTYQFLFYVIFGSHKISTLATMACYLLARHENVQNILRENIADVIKRNQGVFQYSSIDDIEYLDCVIDETLRLYPPVTKIERLASRKLGIKDSPRSIPKGARVTIPICGMHRDPLAFENPNVFDPIRFQHAPPPEFIPFGISPRKCIGETFARMVTKIILVYIVGNFTIAVCPLTKIPPKFGLGTQAFLSIEEMMLSLVAREDSPFEMKRL